MNLAISFSRPLVTAALVSAIILLLTGALMAQDTQSSGQALERTQVTTVDFRSVVASATSLESNELERVCFRCWCDCDDPPPSSTCQEKEYCFHCECEDCNFPGEPLDCREYGDWETCDESIEREGACGPECGSFSHLPVCDDGGGGGSDLQVLLDGTMRVGGHADEGALAMVRAVGAHQVRLQTVPGKGALMRHRCDGSILGRILRPEIAAEIREAMRRLEI